MKRLLYFSLAVTLAGACKQSSNIDTKRVVITGIDSSKKAGDDFFSYANGICRISATVKLGHKAAPPEDPAVETTRSGWMVDRIKRFLEYVPECEEGEWVLPK